MEPESPRPRLLALLALGLLWMAAVLARLGYLQLVCYSDYLARAHHQQERIIEVSPKRGALYDRNGHELAMSVPVDSCFAVPAEISDPELVARLLSRLLGVSQEELAARLASSRSFVWVARKLPPEKARRIQALNLRGVYFQKENRRFYPEHQLAAHVLGYVDIDEHGLGGVEYALDSEVRGRPGRMLVLADARRRWYDRNEQAADAGESVVLTLDENIQYIAEKELAAAIEKTHARAGTVVVEDPNNGELLALANWPTFDANAAGESPPEARRNRAVSAIYEPGSTFKIITLAGAFEEGVARPAEVIDCQMGSIELAGRRIRDWKPFGQLTVARVLEDSSDVGAIKIGLRLGAPRLCAYARAFGFGEPTGIELPSESRGLLRAVEHWSAVSIGSVSIGQEIGVTPVQLVNAVSAIANGGLLYRLHVVRELRKGARVRIPSEPEPRRLVSPTAAATMRQLLESAVREGTGRAARLEGYTAAGKTGTAQKIDPATGRYSRTQYVSSFVGFAPLNNAAVTILVALDSPEGPHHGGEVAAPVFQRVAQQVLAYLDVPRDLPVGPGVQVASLRRASNPVRGPENELVSLGAAQPEAFSRLGAQKPSLSSPAPVLPEGESVTLPPLVGKTVREVTEECSRLGLALVLVGMGVATGQAPRPGARVPRGSRITVHFVRSAAGLPLPAPQN